MRQDNFFSPLDEYESLEQMCIDCFGCSKSFLKKNLSKKELSRKIQAKTVVSFPLEISNRDLVNPTYKGSDIPILFEDEKILALNKPQGIHCYPRSYMESDNCLSFLRSQNYFPFFANREFGLINRLDRVTSGVLFVIKDQLIRKTLRENFRERIVQKEYLAIVEGKLEEYHQLNQLLISTGSLGSKMKISNTSDGLEAKLSVMPVGWTGSYTLVKVRLLTGVRHQIRVQLAGLGYPIVGDELYGADKAQRVFLHCYRYILECDWKCYDISAKKADLFDIFFDLNSIL